MGNIKRISQKACNFAGDESGATAIEYALLASIMGVGIVVSLDLLEDELSAAIDFVKNAVVAKHV